MIRYTFRTPLRTNAAPPNLSAHSGTSPCGGSIAGRPPTLSVGASSLARPSTAGSTSLLSLINVSARTGTDYPMAVA
eukprot:6207278-Pleurochrysis_carterae.AAC.2